MGDEITSDQILWLNEIAAERRKDWRRRDWKDYEWSDDDDLDRLKDDLLGDLPMEIWTESDIGQILLRLAREGRCRYTRLNSTLGRFDKK